MGKVININSKQEGHVKIMHKSGWEKGYKTRGKWNGFYESMGLLPTTKVSYYVKGNFNMGLETGYWEKIYIFHDRSKSIEVHSGKYSKGERTGQWKICEHGKSAQHFLYEEGKIQDSDFVND